MIGSSYPNSAEAFQYYIHGWDAFSNMDIENAIGWLSKTIEVDTGFVNAYVFLSFSYVAVNQDEQSKIWCDKVYDKRDELSVQEKLSLDHLHAYHYETPLEEMRFCRQILEMDEMYTTYWHFLGEAFQNTTFYSWMGLIQIGKN